MHVDSSLSMSDSSHAAADLLRASVVAGGIFSEVEAGLLTALETVFVYIIILA